MKEDKLRITRLETVVDNAKMCILEKGDNSFILFDTEVEFVKKELNKWN